MREKAGVSLKYPQAGAYTLFFFPSVFLVLALAKTHAYMLAEWNQ